MNHTEYHRCDAILGFPKPYCDIDIYEVAKPVEVLKAFFRIKGIFSAEQYVNSATYADGELSSSN